MTRPTKHDRTNPMLRAYRLVWHVHTGRPSWHQQRAGHISAGVMVFHGDDVEGAQRYAAVSRELRPDDPCFILPFNKVI